MKRFKNFKPDVLSNAGPLLARYDVLFCDIWGVVHDGVRAFPASNDALTRFRAGGGTVVLVSNAPTPSAYVKQTLDQKGVAPTAYDAIVCSGDLALAHIRNIGFTRIHRIGDLQRDTAFFSALPGPDAPLDDADAIACTGLIDDRNETGESYRARLSDAARRGLPFVCANPDLVVHVGHKLLPCAGAIAAVYEDMGGPVVWCGKPHLMAYQAAFEHAAKLRGSDVAPNRILVIGDAMRTDLQGAHRAGVDALFVTSGIHRDDVMTGSAIDATRLRDSLATAGIGCAAAIDYLRW